MIKMIASVSQNGFIGIDGKLPWNYPENMKILGQKTKGATVIMGRKTFAVNGSKPLPGRRNIVISRLAHSLGVINDDGVDVFGSVTEALETCQDSGPDVWILGGEKIYEEGMEFAEEIYLTIVPHWIETSYGQESARFPWINPLEFSLKEMVPLIPEKPELKLMLAVYTKGNK